jgi:hypothetical protein
MPSNPPDRFVNPRDYGASNTASGATNVAAFRAAINDLYALGGGTMLIPGGDFALDDTISFDNVNQGIRIVGADKESRLVFGGNMQNGLICNARSIKLEGFTVIAQSTPAMNGVGSLVYCRNGAQLGSEFEQIDIRDLRLEGRPGSDPQNFLALQNPAFMRVHGVGIVAFENESYGSKGNNGVFIFGDVDTIGGSAVGDFSMVGVNVYGVENGFRVVGGTGAQGQQTVEGCSFTDCVVQGARYGLYMSASGYQAPGHSWKGGHVNCDGAPIKLVSWAQFKVSDALFYINAASARKEGHFRLTDCTEIFAHHNHCFHFGTTGPDNGAGISGFAMDGNTSLCRADHNDFIGFQPGSGAIYNAGTGGGNRADFNGKQGGGVLLAGNVQDLGGNHFF